MRFIDQHYSQSPVFESEGKAKEKEEKWLKWADEVLVRALLPNLSEFRRCFKGF
jgi:hypothetical protein